MSLEESEYVAEIASTRLQFWLFLGFGAFLFSWLWFVCTRWPSWLKLVERTERATSRLDRSKVLLDPKRKLDALIARNPRFIKGFLLTMGCVNLVIAGMNAWLLSSLSGRLEELRQEQQGIAPKPQVPSAVR